MAKYTGADCRQCRREGAKLFLKGERCYSAKCAILKRAQAPGQHGAGRKKVTDYGVQLREKQKTKRMYGLCEKQFHNYYVKAETMRGVTGENMLVLLERRLDNVVYRLGVGVSRAQARQIVNHGLVTVNGKRLNIPSYLTKVGDKISIKDNKLEKMNFKDLRAAKTTPNVKWLSFENDKLLGTVLALPERADIDASIQEHMIVELYSK